MFHRRRTPPPPVHLGCAVSRNDFIDSLRLLDARMSVPQRCEVGTLQCELQDISLNCSRDVWERVIGPPRNILCHFSTRRRGIYHSWEHHWIGGSVKCFGCLFERASESQWLFLSRVLFFKHRSEMPPIRKPAKLERPDAARQPA
jgi:hypothetical protein